MYNRRVPKTSARVDAYGFVDELNAALGVVRAQERDSFLGASIEKVQDQLVTLLGELATDPSDRERYLRDGFKVVEPEFVNPVDELVVDLEGRNLSFKGWAKPGDNPTSAALDVARCVCRRAERQVCLLVERGEEPNREIQRYLNRLSDVIWLFARWVETGRPEAAAA